MTGFGSAQRTAGEYVCRCDIRSVNGKGLDIKMRMPSGLEPQEASIKKQVSERLARGNVQVFLIVDRAVGKDGPTIDLPVLRALHTQALTASKDLDLPPPTLEGLLALRGVVTTEDGGAALDPDDPTLKDLLPQIIGEALTQLVIVREEEGAALVGILTQQLKSMAKLIADAEADPESQPEAIKERFSRQLNWLVGSDAAIDPQRLAAEAAILVTKADIREEIDRLKTHIDAGRALIDEGKVIGRRLDFLTQEFNREANTLCSKSGSKALTAIGLQMKAVIDQMREQVQNLQ